MIDAVRRSGGHLLYRGYPVASCLRLEEPADLLEASTYGRDGLKYFQAMEHWFQLHPTLTSSVRPSCGHIGSADKQVAARWGGAHSCWPVGRFSYAWLRGSDVFYPLHLTEENESVDYRDFLDRNLVVDEGLDFALRNGKEIMFSSDHYWIFPSERDDEIRELLIASSSYN
eukprot:746424-Hanusia_phi.AAC.9